MDYSLNKRKMTIGSMKGKEVYVASPVCQKQRISFDKLCARMAEDTTVGDADVAAVFHCGCRPARNVSADFYVESRS